MNHNRSGFGTEMWCTVKNVDRLFSFENIRLFSDNFADVLDRGHIRGRFLFSDFYFLCLNWTWNWFFFFWKTFSFLRRRFRIHPILGRVSFRNSFILNLLFCFTFFPHFLLAWWPSICFRLFHGQNLVEMGHLKGSSREFSVFDLERIKRPNFLVVSFQSKWVDIWSYIGSVTRFMDFWPL